MSHTAQACKDHNGGGDKWFVRGECEEISNLLTTDATPEQIVFTVLLPHKGLDMSRWHQFIVGVISFEVDVKDKPRKYITSDVSDYAFCMH